MADYHPDEKLIKRPQDDTPLSEWEQEEWLRCAADKYYFFENYVYVQTPSGRKNFAVRDYQKRILDECDNSRHVAILSGRQSGKSASLSCDILYEIIFNEDWQVLIGTYSNSQVLDFMDRISYAYQSLPWWLKPPAVVFNKFSIRFDNGSSVIGQTFSERLGRGKSLNRIILDEIGFCDNKLSTAMMRSLLGSISADGENSTTRLNIASTPNGTANEFSYIWHAAIQGDSTFSPVEVKYEEIPGRTEKFEKEMLKTMSRDSFDQEFLCVAGDSLIECVIDGEEHSLSIEELYELL